MINLIYSGIIYFYRFHLNATSFHLFIHRVSAKLSNRVMPYGENSGQLQLLFVLDYTDLIDIQGSVIQWTLTLALFVGLVSDAVYMTTPLLSRPLLEFRIFRIPAGVWNRDSACVFLLCATADFAVWNNQYLSFLCPLWLIGFSLMFD